MIDRKTISILGCGWLGFSLGEALVGAGYVVKGSTTREEKLAKIAGAGMQAYQLEVGETLEGRDLDDFFESEVLILNIPPGRREPDVESRYPRQVKMIVEAAMRGGLAHLLLVSSTGVYGSNNGVVREDDELAPETASGRALVAAEEYVRGLAWSATVLRLAGLVGGERHPGRWFAGKTELDGGEVPVNLVHRDDVIAAILAIVAQERWGEVYQLCAEEHPLKKDYYPAMARRLGLEEPIFSGPALVPYKVVGNEKIKRALGLVLQYPDPMQFP